MDKFVQWANVIALLSASALVGWTKTLTLAKISDQKWHIADVYSLWQDLTHGTIICDLNLEGWSTFEIFNLGHNFQTRRDRAFILHMCFFVTMVPYFLTLWLWPWRLTYFWTTLTLAAIYWWLWPRECRCLLTICMFFVTLMYTLLTANLWSFWPDFKAIPTYGMIFSACLSVHLSDVNILVNFAFKFWNWLCVLPCCLHQFLVKTSIRPEGSLENA